jgi:hypothetical protein
METSLKDIGVGKPHFEHRIRIEVENLLETFEVSQLFRNGLSNEYGLS